MTSRSDGDVVRIAKLFKFEAAHLLPDHDGKCANLHGHSYKIIVELEGPIETEGPKAGMVVDFTDIGWFWKNALEKHLDHQYLNDSLEPWLGAKPTTAENIAEFLLETFSDNFKETVAVTVWETETSWARASV